MKKMKMKTKLILLSMGILAIILTGLIVSKQYNKEGFKIGDCTDLPSEWAPCDPKRDATQNTKCEQCCIDHYLFDKEMLAKCESACYQEEMRRGNPLNLANNRNFRMGCPAPPTSYDECLKLSGWSGKCIAGNQYSNCAMCCRYQKNGEQKCYNKCAEKDGSYYKPCKQTPT